MFYLLDKPKGITSFKAIKSFAKENKIAKVGHTGTLDPLASGLLLIATDEDTKLIEYVDKGYKTYIASMILGKTSDTYDIEGAIVDTNVEVPNYEMVKSTLLSFEGFSMQMPPLFSAKKINGQKAYDLAREGKEVKLQAVLVEIKAIQDFHKINTNEYSFEVAVSRGTYIRSIIHDLGQKLQCGAIMSDLRRTHIGKHSLVEKDSAISVLDLLTLPLIRGLSLKDLIHGKEIVVSEQEGIYALEHNNDVLGIVEVKNNYAKGIKLLGNKFKKLGV